MLGSLYKDIVIYRNDKISIKDIQKLSPKAIVISPGPGEPKDAGICTALIKKLGSKIPMLGVCLGLQAMAEAFGGKVVLANTCVHGKATWVFHRGQGIFKDIALPFEAGRYHSLVVESHSLPKELIVEAIAPDGLIMALSHVHYPLWGVQFHPESILTPLGDKLLKNFVEYVKTVH